MGARFSFEGEGKTLERKIPRSTPFLPFLSLITSFNLDNDERDKVYFSFLTPRPGREGRGLNLSRRISMPSKH